MEYVKLNNGVEMPLLGLGTYPLKGKIMESAVINSNEAGYQLYDSALSYKNEKTIGKTLRQLEVPREKVFIVSKIKAYHFLGRRRYLHLDKKSVDCCYRRSLKNFGFKYLDLYLTHSFIEPYFDVWGEMVKLYERGG